MRDMMAAKLSFQQHTEADVPHLGHPQVTVTVTHPPPLVCVIPITRRWGRKS